MARALAAIGDARSLLVLREALCGVERFDAMHTDLGVPRSVLANRLGRLVESGILERQNYREPGKRTRQRYCLTEKGRALAPALLAMREWAERHLPGGPSRLQFRHTDGQAVATLLVKEDGSAVDDLSEVVAVRADR